MSTISIEVPEGEYCGNCMCLIADHEGQKWHCVPFFEIMGTFLYCTRKDLKKCPACIKACKQSKEQT